MTPAPEAGEAGRAVAAALRALAEVLAEAGRVAAEACDPALTVTEAVGSLLPLEGMIEEAAALHAAAVAMHRRSRAAGAATTD